MALADRCVNIATQTAKGSLASSSSQTLNPEHWALSPKRAGITKDAIGTVGTAIYSSGNARYDLSFDITARPKNIDYILHCAFGTATYDSNTGKNTWTTPSASVDFATIFLHDATNFDKDRQCGDSLLKTLTIDVPSGDVASVSVAWDVGDLNLANDGNTTSSFDTTAPFIASDTTITVGGSSYSIGSLSVTLDRSNIIKDAIGSPEPAVMTAGGIKVSGSFDVVEPDDDFIEMVLSDVGSTGVADEQTSKAIVVTLQNGQTYTGGDSNTYDYELKLTIPKVYITSVTEDTSGREIPTLSVNYVAVYDSTSSSILKAELSNNVDASGY